ncbi:helix-turn-helix domain-containing protein [Exiguobacterium flavidum]|uniref:helix-turn-helix domain-containing protein n=1 Tax=Exiguobacterium flavidum TaxID=2184695 RepID=UPI000DF7ABFF|nr:helix-turn-helix domain-containing protein [Exiguobacterium flavidum]
MEPTFIERILLEAIFRLEGERTDRSLFHVIQGKRSATTLQDAHFYRLDSLFGMVPLDPKGYEEQLNNLIRKGWIRNVPFELTEEGRGLIGHTFIVDGLGGECRGYSLILWKRFSLLLQTLLCLKQKTTFIPVQQDEGTKSWVRHTLRTIEDRDAWIETAYRELRNALESLEGEDATLITYRLSGNRTGLSLPQLAERLDVDTLSIRMQFQQAWVSCLKSLPESGLIHGLARDVSRDKMTTSAARTYELLRLGLSIEEIKSRRRLKDSTMEDHLVEIAMYGDRFPLEQFVPESVAKEIRMIQQSEGTFALKRIRQNMKQECSYFQIRIVLARLVKEVL